MDRRFRFLSIAVFISFLFASLVFQFYKIQIFQYDKWSHLAKQQHYMVVKEPCRRGSFFSNPSLKIGDVKDVPFVVDIVSYHLHMDPSLIPSCLKEKMCVELQNVLATSSDLSVHFMKKSRYRKVAKGIASSKKEKVDRWWELFSKKNNLAKRALYWKKDYQRSYPFGKSLGQVLQTVQEERLENGVTPTGGLELFFHNYLQGEEGKREILRSPKYEIDNGYVEKRSKNGKDVYLTIHHVLQAIAEEELAKGIERVEAKGGVAVMMDPHSGEIYAVAHYPFFDPSCYKEYYKDLTKIEQTRNKAVSDCFEPGSIMKPISLAIALKANQELLKRGEKSLFSPEEMMRCDEAFFPGRLRPLRDVHPHKYLNMYMSIQKSSNIYPARLIQKVMERLGPEWYRRQLADLFGFGEKTGVEVPYENPGLLPTPGKRHANGSYEWSSPTPYSLAIGYNLMVNAMQMTRAFSVLVNGGYLVKPTLLKKIVSKEGGMIHNVQNLSKKKVLDGSITKEIVKAMKFVTKQGGSATLADISGFTEAGKTGSSEKLIEGRYSKEKHFSTFIGCAPVTFPKFVLFIGVDEPKKVYVPGFGTTHFGGKCAAPIFREIGKRSLEYLGVPPDDLSSDWKQEVMDLKKLYEAYNCAA